MLIFRTPEIEQAFLDVINHEADLEMRVRDSLLHIASALSRRATKVELTGLQPNPQDPIVKYFDWTMYDVNGTPFMHGGLVNHGGYYKPVWQSHS